MDAVVTPNLFDCVRSGVERVCRRAQEDRMLIITEGDLQARVFAELITNPTIRDSGIHVHTQINYLKDDELLGHVPDIVLLPPSAYSVDIDGELHDRKGYTISGSSVAIELKLLRSHRHDGFVGSIEADIEKLKSIRDRHYTPDPAHSFFAALVVLCRQRLPDTDVFQIQCAARNAGIELWHFNPID